MTLLRLAVILSVLAFGTGLVAAYYWYRSSQIQPDPGWRVGPPSPELTDLRPIEPLDLEAKNSGRVLAAVQAFSESAELNKRAAIWTAVSVAFAAISSICGSL